MMQSNHLEINICDVNVRHEQTSFNIFVWIQKYEWSQKYVMSNVY